MQIMQLNTIFMCNKFISVLSSTRLSVTAFIVIISPFVLKKMTKISVTLCPVSLKDIYQCHSPPVCSKLLISLKFSLLSVSIQLSPL